MDVAKTVPDTITKWAAGAFCTSRVGFGVALKTDLTAFKPFFVSLTLPYSVIRGETFTLKATVFNYLPKCIRVSPLNVFTCLSWSGFASVCSKSNFCINLFLNKGEGHAGRLADSSQLSRAEAALTLSVFVLKRATPSSGLLHPLNWVARCFDFCVSKH